MPQQPLGRSDAEDEDMAYVRVSRAELMRGHRRRVAMAASGGMADVEKA